MPSQNSTVLVYYIRVSTNCQSDACIALKSLLYIEQKLFPLSDKMAERCAV